MAEVNAPMLPAGEQSIADGITTRRIHVACNARVLYNQFGNPKQCRTSRNAHVANAKWNIEGAVAEFTGLHGSKGKREHHTLFAAGTGTFPRIGTWPAIACVTSFRTSMLPAIVHFATGLRTGKEKKNM